MYVVRKAPSNEVKQAWFLGLAPLPCKRVKEMVDLSSGGVDRAGSSSWIGCGSLAGPVVLVEVCG